MGRVEITAGLSALIERHLASQTCLWSKEVTIDQLEGCRPDYVSVSAYFGKFATTAAIERALVTVYEIKSCLADYKSGFGLNAIGDQNILVLPYKVMMQITELICDGKLDDHDKAGVWGRAYPIPVDYSLKYSSPHDMPDYVGQVDGWKLNFIPNDSPYVSRNIALVVILWAMMYAGPSH